MKYIFKPRFNWFDLATLAVASSFYPTFGWLGSVGIVAIGALISAAAELRFCK